MTELVTAAPEGTSAPQPAGRNWKTRFRTLYILLRHPSARLGFIIVGLLILISILAPFIAKYKPTDFLDSGNLKPSEQYLLGTDPMGRDEFALTVWGGRVSLLVGFGMAAVAIVIATIIGLIAGYYRGWVDDIFNLIINLFLVIPSLPLLILLSAYLQPSNTTVILTLAFTSWAFHARILRAQTMSLREKDYVAAAVVAGENGLSIIFRQILPNLINLIVGGFIGLTIYGIAASTALAFLGLTSMDQISWGTNLFWAQNGNSLLLGAWWVFIPSGFLVALSALGLALINFGMDEITNPRLRAERMLRAILRHTGFQRVRITPVSRQAEPAAVQPAELPKAVPGLPAEKLLDVQNLRVEYLTESGPVRAVDDVSFSIAKGEIFGLAGESGCGKSTIAHSVLRVLRPPAVITGGNVFYKGIDILDFGEKRMLSTPGAALRKDGLADLTIESFRWAEISMVFQSAMNSLNPVIRVVDQITDVLMTHKKIGKQEARQRAEELMEVVNIDKRRLNAYPHELSGGMRQRMVIAMALALKPDLMIMDEPTTALDVVVQKDILQQIEQLKAKLGFSILFITHDLSLMVEFSDRIGIMYAGELVEMAPAKEILTRPYHPYTVGLLNSFPSIKGARKKLTGIPGSPPNLLNPPKGCRFHERCPYYDGKDESVPRLREMIPGHWVACNCVDLSIQGVK